MGRWETLQFPSSVSKIQAKDRRARRDAGAVLGQWLIPPDAAPAFEQRYWRETDPEIRRLLITGLQNLVSDFDQQRTLAERILAREQDQATAREWRDGIDATEQTLAWAKAKKKPSATVLGGQRFGAGWRSGFFDLEEVSTQARLPTNRGSRRLRGEAR